MLILSILALLSTMIIGYLYETFKMRQTMNEIKKTNSAIDRLLNDAPVDSSMDIFMVNSLREFFSERLLATHLVDDFRLYKKDNRHIAMTYRRKMAIQNLELCIDALGRSLSVGEIEYIENPFEEIHL